MLKGVSLLLLLLMASCKDNPYKNHIAKEQVPYAFNGVVELGAPVVGAKVIAYQFSDLKKGEKLAETVSNRDGSFELKFSTDYEGPLLLTASEGLYRDLARNETTAVKPEKELQSAITHISMPERTNINAWTTLAVARIMAEKGFWDKNVAHLKDRDRIDVDFNNVAQFLSAKSSKTINIRRQELFDIERDNFELESSKTLLHLAHGGLSQLAKIISDKLPPGYVITVLDIVSALSEDLSDRIFDGKNASGLPVFIDVSRNLNLSSQTMRKDFSESILLYGESLKNWNEAYRLKLSEYVDPIAADKSPEFFPEKEEPALRDVVPPKIFVSFQGDHINQTPFAQMSGGVFFNVKATDETGVAELRSLSPRAENIGASGKFGPFGLDYVSNPNKVASECGQEKEFYQEIEERKLDILDLVCACFEAKDVFGNSQKLLSCFKRKKIDNAVEFPSPKAIITGKDLLDGFPLKAKVTSGATLTSCEWWITNDPKLEPGENSLLKGQGLINANTCVIDNHVAAKNFSNGEYRLVIIANDVLGRSLSVGKFEMNNVVSFKIIKDPPAVEILSPKNGEFIAGKTIKVVGSFEDKDSIEKISVSYKGVDGNNKEIFGSLNVSLSDPMNIWKAELGFDLPKGGYEIGLTVVDKYGNERVMAPRRVILDETRPTIAPVSHLISTTHIAGYRQIFAYTRDDIDRIEPILATRSNSGRAEFYRWSSEIFDESKAPVFRFSINDENNTKEIKYAINDRCSNIEQAKFLGRNSGVYEVKILPRTAQTDLLRSKELCLSIWAVDWAGNAERKDTLISWNVSVPPVSVHINSAIFENNRMNLDGAIWTSDNYNIQLNRGSEIGYAVITNQFLNPLEVSLKLERPMILDLVIDSHGVWDRKIDISNNLIGIQYYYYDRSTDRVGSRVYPSRSDRVLADANSSLLAKFILKDNFGFQTFMARELSPFYQFHFPRINNDQSGVKVNTADPRADSVSSYNAYYPKSSVVQRGYTR